MNTPAEQTQIASEADRIGQLAIDLAKEAKAHSEAGNVADAIGTALVAANCLRVCRALQEMKAAGK